MVKGVEPCSALTHPTKQVEEADPVVGSYPHFPPLTPPRPRYSTPRGPVMGGGKEGRRKRGGEHTDRGDVHPQRQLMSNK